MKLQVLKFKHHFHQLSAYNLSKVYRKSTSDWWYLTTNLRWKTFFVTWWIGGAGTALIYLPVRTPIWQIWWIDSCKSWLFSQNRPPRCPSHTQSHIWNTRFVMVHCVKKFTLKTITTTITTLRNKNNQSTATTVYHGRQHHGHIDKPS